MFTALRGLLLKRHHRCTFIIIAIIVCCLLNGDDAKANIFLPLAKWLVPDSAWIVQTPGLEEKASGELWQAVELYKVENRFNVTTDVGGRNVTRSQRQLQCELKARVPLRTIRAGDGPFSGEDWDGYLPKQSLEETLGALKTCAVVMSSGSIRNSKLGAEIDEHDAVLRFNSAPTEGYSIDVGGKTTLRLVNSQLMTSKEAGFLTSPLYNTGVLVMWDPAPYSKDLYAWYRKPDFDWVQTYRDYRKLHPQQPFYILSPAMQWDLWEVIQKNSPVDIQPNPPSSGMLGTIAMASLCQQVRVYEFLPSYRRTGLCHYFENIVNEQCTLGHYHPLKFEKDLVRRLNRGTNYDIYAFGRVTLHGFSQQKCP